jgi:TRAP transporter TAXI family solute receptor
MKKRCFARKVLVLSVLFSICVFLSPVHAAKYYSMGTGSPAATYYYLGAGFANLFKKHLPDVRITVESTAASAENVNLINRGKIDFGFSAPTVIKTMLEEKKLDPKNVAIMCIGHATVTHWLLRKESPIKSVYDFKGKKIAVGPPGSGTLVNMKNNLKIGWNINYEEIRPAYLSNQEIITAIKENTIDAGKLTAGVPTPSILDLSRSMPIRILQLEKDSIDRLIASDPGVVHFVIKGKTYSGNDEDINTQASVSGLFCRKDLSEDLIYDLVKVLYEHQKERDAIHPAAREYVLENALAGTQYIRKYIPVHPGMVRYLKEKNLWKE